MSALLRRNFPLLLCAIGGFWIAKGHYFTAVVCAPIALGPEEMHFPCADPLGDLRPWLRGVQFYALGILAIVAGAIFSWRQWRTTQGTDSSNFSQRKTI